MWTPAPAAAQSFHIRTYSENDGLPSSDVYDVTQGTDGRIWFLTRAGIGAYDGLVWTRIGANRGLPAADFRRIRVDARNRVWLLAVHPEVMVYRLADGRWTALPSPSGAELLPHQAAFALAEGEDAPEVVLGSGDAVLLWSGGRWRRLGPADGLAVGTVHAVAFEGERLWVAGERGLALIVDGNVMASGPTARSVQGEAILALAVGPARGAGGRRLWLRGEDWVGFTTPDGVERLRGGLPLSRTARGTVRLQPDGLGGAFTGDSTSVLHIDRQGELRRLTSRNGLAGDATQGLLLDREGNVWVATVRGVSKIVSMRFVNYTAREGLLEDEVTAIAESASGELVFGHPLGLTFFDGQSFRRRRLVDPAGETWKIRILDLAYDQRGDLWAALASGGLARLPRQGGRVRWYGETEGLMLPVTSVLEDADGRLVVASSATGLFRLEGDRFRAVKTEPPLPHGIRKLFRRSHSLWLATFHGLLELREGRWRRIRGPEEPGAESIYGVLTDRRGRTWVGTRDGLFRLRGSFLLPPTGDEPRIRRPVYFMVEDADGALWFGLDNGVVRWDGQVLRHFTTAEGLAGRETNRAAGFVDRHGHLWIGTATGVSRYDPTMDLSPRPPLAVSVAAAEASGRALEPGGVRRVAHDENDLVFFPRVVSFTDEDALELRERLTGFEDAWSAPRPYRGIPIRYTNLPPGRYRLEIQARTGQGPWSETARSVEVVVEPAVWTRPWFYLALAAALLALGGLIAGTISRQRYTLRLEDAVRRRTASLEESEARYRTLVENAPEAIMVLDVDAGHFVELNQNAVELFGYPRDTLFGLGPADLSPAQQPDGRPSAALIEEWTRRALDGEVQTFEWLHRRSDGVEIPCEVRLARVLSPGRRLVRGSVTDIRERKRAEEALRASEEKFRSLFEDSKDTVFITSPDGRILDINPAGVELFGYGSRQEMLSLDVARDLYWDPSERERHIRVADVQGFVRDRELRLKRRDGTELIVLETTTAARDAAGRVVEYRGVLRDITEQRALEGRLRRAQRLQAVGQLTAGLAHEFNNLLMVVLGNLDLLGEHLGSDVSALDLRDNAARAARRGARLVEQLLAFARKRQLRPREVDVNRLVSELGVLVGGTLGRAVRLEIRLADDLWSVEVDADGLENALMNLVVNGRDAMPEGGRLVIETANRALGEEEAERLELRPGEYVALEVRDTGCGIAPENLEHVFQPFFTTKEVGKGTGLGLSMVYGFVRQSGGSVDIGSCVGSGTTVSLYLPRLAV